MKTIDQFTDNQLVRLFQQGDGPALEILVNRYKDKIFTSILFLVKDKYIAEDLFQDVFIKIIDTIRNNRYTEEGKFLSWATRISHNLCVDYFRKLKRSPSFLNSEVGDVFAMIDAPESNVDVKMMNLETHEKITRLLEMLPAEQREVIVLRHYADMSFKEIASITDCSINTALGRMRYGLINLRKILSEKQIAL